eukprot:739060-Prymnesium_polylepis.1
MIDVTHITRSLRVHAVDSVAVGEPKGVGAVQITVGKLVVRDPLARVAFDQHPRIEVTHRKKPLASNVSRGSDLDVLSQPQREALVAHAPYRPADGAQRSYYRSGRPLAPCVLRQHVLRQHGRENPTRDRRRRERKEDGKPHKKSSSRLRCSSPDNSQRNLSSARDARS